MAHKELMFGVLWPDGHIERDIWSTRDKAWDYVLNREPDSKILKVITFVVDREKE